MASDNPFHEGELAVQARAGEGQSARATGGAIKDRISSRAMQFIERQPMVIVGSLDSTGRVWASVLFGKPGFLHAENDRTLALSRAEPSRTPLPVIPFGTISKRIPESVCC